MTILHHFGASYIGGDGTPKRFAMMFGAPDDQPADELKAAMTAQIMRQDPGATGIDIAPISAHQIRG